MLSNRWQNERLVPPRGPNLMLVRPIDTLLPRASRSFGAKARNLAALVRAGFPVPAGYAVSGDAAAQFFERVLPPALRPEQLLSAARATPTQLAEARERVLGAELDAGLIEELQRALGALHAAAADSVAVRSSNTVDDLAASFGAGLHTSVLNVRGEPALLAAVRQCYAHLFTPRIASALHSFGVERVDAMGLVIQAMVPADVSGVLFTCNPLSGDPDEIVIDASYGLGTTVTEGRFTPDTYRIHKQTGWVRDRVIADKRVRTVAGPDGLRDEPVAPAKAQKQALDEHMLARLLALGHRIEDHFGDDRDVEFAIAADAIYVLQARPISALVSRTGRGRARRRPRGLTSHAGDVVWSNVSIGEALPGVATPLTWSVLSEFSELGFSQAFAALGCKFPRNTALVGNFRGRIYLNLSELTQIAAQVPGLRPSLILPIDGSAELERLERDRPTPNSARVLLRLPLTAARFAASHVGFRSRLTQFETSFEAERARIESMDFRILSSTALDATLSDVHRMLNEAGGMLLRAYGGSLSVLAAVRAALVLHKGEQAANVQHTLLSAIEDVESAGPGREIQRVATAFQADAAASAQLLSVAPPSALGDLPEGPARAAVEQFLQRHGHRGMREAEIAEPRWREDPRLVFDAVRTQLEHGRVDAAGLQRRVEAVRAAGEAELADLPLALRAPLRALLTMARDNLRLRESLRSRVVQVLGLFRLVALDASRRLAVREPDIGKDAAFFLTLPELHGVLRGELRSAAGLVRLRRTQYRRDRSLPDPPQSFVGFPPPPAPPPDPSECLQGLGASAGAVEGAVRVLRSTDEASSLVPGEILVVPSADVGWSPIFIVAGGLVTDLGGPLSHACVAAREYGLPAVVNVRSATRTLKTGERVRLDGDAGTVQRLRP
jgi:phosphohistidine swiveling domain-containing protein